jgi:hypothetical protein
MQSTTATSFWKDWWKHSLVMAYLRPRFAPGTSRIQSGNADLNKTYREDGRQVQLTEDPVHRIYAAELSVLLSQSQLSLHKRVSQHTQLLIISKVKKCDLPCWVFHSSIAGHRVHFMSCACFFLCCYNDGSVLNNQNNYSHWVYLWRCQLRNLILSQF